MESTEAPTQRPVLGIAGFFGHGNYGDELFLSVFEEYFGDDFELKVIPDLPTKPYFSRDVAEIVSEVDAILIGGGDLVRPWGIDPRYFNGAYLEKPVYILGIGVAIRGGAEPLEKPHITKRYRKFMQHPNVRFLGVRDQQSGDWITRYVEPEVPVSVAPDIVCALSLPSVERGQTPILGIVTRFRPNLEAPDDYSRLEELAAHAKSHGWSVRHIVLGTGIVGERDIENADDLDVPGKELIHSEDLDVLSRAIGECRALASMKFHGTVVATMYGVPSLVLIPTSKNRNFMRRMSRGELLSRFDAKDLIEKFGDHGPPEIDANTVASLRIAARDLLLEVRAAVHRDLKMGSAGGD